MPRLSPEQLALKKGPNVRQIDEAEPGMDKEVVDTYLASVKSAVNSKSEVSEVSGVEDPGSRLPKLHQEVASGLLQV